MFVTPGVAGDLSAPHDKCPRTRTGGAIGAESSKRVVWHQSLDQGPTGLRLYILGDVLMGLFSGDPFYPAPGKVLKVLQPPLTTFKDENVRVSSPLSGRGYPPSVSAGLSYQPDRRSWRLQTFTYSGSRKG